MDGTDTLPGPAKEPLSAAARKTDRRLAAPALAEPRFDFLMWLKGNEYGAAKVHFTASTETGTTLPCTLGTTSRRVLQYDDSRGLDRSRALLEPEKVTRAKESSRPRLSVCDFWQDLSGTGVCDVGACTLGLHVCPHGRRGRRRRARGRRRSCPRGRSSESAGPCHKERCSKVCRVYYD